MRGARLAVAAGARSGPAGRERRPGSRSGGREAGGWRGRAAPGPRRWSTGPPGRGSVLGGVWALPPPFFFFCSRRKTGVHSSSEHPGGHRPLASFCPGFISPSRERA